MGRDDFSNPIHLDSVGDAIQLQQHHSRDAQTLTNDEFSKVSIFRDQDASFRIGHLNYALIRSSLAGLCNSDDIVAVSPKFFDDLARDILVSEKAHHSAAITVSCSR